MNICAITTNFFCVSTKKKKGLPCGVEEAVPCDAVSRCCWRKKPESRSAAPINLPLKPIIAVFHWNKYRRKKSTEVLLTLDIYSRYLINYSAETEPHSSCSPTEYSGGGFGLKKTYRRIWNLMFYVSNLWSREGILRVYTNYNYTLAKSKGSLMFFSSWLGNQFQTPQLGGLSSILAIKWC